MHDLARSQGRNGKLAHSLERQAVARQQSGDPDRALKELETSLGLAQTVGMIRAYVEEGRSVEELLQRHLRVP